jgi:hypothetical protein
MKSILLPIDQNEHMPSALETSRLAASLFDGVVEGVALCPKFTEIVTEPMVAAVIPPFDWNEADYIRRVRWSFHRYAAQHSTEPKKVSRFRWRGGSVLKDASLVLLRQTCHLFFRFDRGWEQHGHRSSRAARRTAISRRRVAIEFGTWRSVRIGGAPGSVIFGKGRHFDDSAAPRL